jgi:hypothetical protein
MSESTVKVKLFFVKLSALARRPKALVVKGLEIHVTTHQKNISDYKITTKQRNI